MIRVYVGRCFYCKRKANWKSINSKKLRCVEVINLCPGFIEKCQKGRERDRKALTNRMRAMNKKAQSSLKKLIKNPSFRKRRSKHMSEAIELRGGHGGKNNPMYGKTHSKETRRKMKKAAATRDNSKVGKWERQPKHREQSSKRLVNLIKNGKIKSSNTKPEKQCKSILRSLKIPFRSQFLIEDTEGFRHLYDIKLVDRNLLVEVDGDYWHSFPKAKKRDRLCERKAKEKGLKVLRIAESELKKNPKVVESKILKEYRGNA